LLTQQLANRILRALIKKRGYQWPNCMRLEKKSCIERLHCIPNLYVILNHPWVDDAKINQISIYNLLRISLYEECGRANKYPLLVMAGNQNWNLLPDLVKTPYMMPQPRLRSPLNTHDFLNKQISPKDQFSLLDL
jgi:hypothetical protein